MKVESLANTDSPGGGTVTFTIYLGKFAWGGVFYFLFLFGEEPLGCATDWGLLEAAILDLFAFTSFAEKTLEETMLCKSDVVFLLAI